MIRYNVLEEAVPADFAARLSGPHQGTPLPRAATTDERLRLRGSSYTNILHRAKTIQWPTMLPRPCGNARCQATGQRGGRCHARVHDSAIDAHWPILPLSREPQRQRPLASRRYASCNRSRPSILLSHLVLHIVFAASAATHPSLWPSTRPARFRYVLPRVPDIASSSLD